MSSLYGWAGRISQVDLGERKITEMETESYSERFVGVVVSGLARNVTGMVFMLRWMLSITTILYCDGWTFGSYSRPGAPKSLQALTFLRSLPL